MTPIREIPFGRPWILDADREAVLRVLSGHILTHGPECKGFEADFAAFAGAGAHCVSVSSCMAALHLSYLHLGLQPGDEVIAPALTHVAAVHGIEWVGARPVFVDAEPATGNITADRIAAAITPRTRAISLVHFAGIPCEMPPIQALAEKHGLKIVEDCAIALGARWKGTHVGLFGDYATFSFYPVKHITTAEGGMITTTRPEIAAKIGRQKAFGVDRQHGDRKVPGVYDVTMLGFNYRMNEIEAAIGIEQMKRLEDILAIRGRNYRALHRTLREIDEIALLETGSGDFQSSYYCLSILLNARLAGLRFELVSKLNAAGVGTSVYYPKAVPDLTYYREKYGFAPGSFPNASWISDASIALPVGPHLNEDDMAYIAATVRAAILELKP
jgi:perosamine synthetase